MRVAVLDFVPAAKLARREGLHFILDAMHHSIRDDLSEHIDKLTSTISSQVSKLENPDGLQV